MGTTRRLGHIFRSDERTVIVALDHGLVDGPIEGLVDPAATIAQVISGGADAVLTSHGIARRFANELADVGLILRCDGVESSLGGRSDEPTDLAIHAEDALRCGADAVGVSAFPGSAAEVSSLRSLADIIGDASSWNLPVMAEMVPGGFDSPPEMRSTEAVATAARVGAEMGADFIKAPYTEDFATVTAACFVPVVILGGSRGGAKATLEHIRSAIDCGGAGVAIGRNVFQADDPTAMTTAIAAIVHDDVSVEVAMRLL